MSPPYAPKNAGLGGVPSTTVDAPITSVFLLLFLIGATGNMTILQINRRHGHKFLASGALFGLCMSRTLTCTLRLVWSTHQTSVPISIAANVFVNAGVVIIIIINIIFAQRILRASHPSIGWHPITRGIFKAYFASIVLMLIALITSIVQQSYSLDSNTLRIDRDIQLVGATYNAAASFLPIPIVLLAVLFPRTGERKVVQFGTGRYRTKIAVVLTSSILICLGASFRCGIAYVPRLAADPAWYQSKACFYCFTMVLEILVIYMYIFVRVDRRFHIPDGAKGPGSYGSGKLPMFNTEEEFLDDAEPAENGTKQWEKRAEEEGLAVSMPVQRRGMLS
jgi:hypothetical protein